MSFDGYVISSKPRLFRPVSTHGPPVLRRPFERQDWLLAYLRSFNLERLTSQGALELHTAAEGLGCFYVIEGSSLGGLTIAREAQRRLAITPESGGRYFFGLGKETKVIWLKVLEDINSIPSTLR